MKSAKPSLAAGTMRARTDPAGAIGPAALAAENPIEAASEAHKGQSARSQPWRGGWLGVDGDRSWRQKILLHGRQDRFGGVAQDFNGDHEGKRGLNADRRQAKPKGVPIDAPPP